MLPIFPLAGTEPAAFTALPEGSCQTPPGCEAELLQQISAAGQSTRAVIVQAANEQQAANLQALGIPVISKTQLLR